MDERHTPSSEGRAPPFKVESRVPHIDDYSLEMTAKDRDALDIAAPYIAPRTQIAVTFLPNESIDHRIDAAQHIRQLGFEPMPHLSARRIRSREELFAMIERLTARASVKRVFLVAGDPPEPQGPFEDTLAMLSTGVFEGNGIETVGIAGHPEGHPILNETRLTQFMERKLSAIADRGMESLIVTQFVFDPDRLLSWLKSVRAKGILSPVRLGVPGPASVQRLLRYAAFCGVGASTAVLKKYGISLTNLLANAGPGELVDALLAQHAVDLRPYNLHFYPFGGLEATVRWINNYEART